MKIKNFHLILFSWLALGSLTALSFTLHTAPETYQVNTQASVVNWKAYKVTGEHFGTVTLKSGTLQLTDGKLTGGAFEMDMTTIKVLDAQGEWATKLEKHLKADDFFGVEKHPASRFTITKVASRGTAGNYRLTGNLTIKAITKEIKFDATINVADGKATGDAALKVDRTDFDIRFRSGNFFEDLGDKTIYDEFDLNVKLVAAK